MPLATPKRRSLRLNRAVILGQVLFVSACLALSGCSALADGPIARWFAARNAPNADPTSGSTPADDQNPGLMSRWLTGEKNPFASGKMGQTSVLVGDKGWQKMRTAPDPAAEAEFAVAKKYFDAKQYDKAEELFAKLAKREVKKISPVGERAQYYLAETQFQRKKYVDAHDSFEILFKKYEGNEHTEQLVQREFQIAQIWLATEDPKAKPMPWQSHFDGRQPLFDTRSFAVKALEHVRNNDPTGPLADDAVLRMADHYHNVGDFENAAIYYDQLAIEHPKSEFKERAMLSSIDSKIKGYIGPEYDVSGLESAQKTIRATLAEFPEHGENAKDLYRTTDLIQDAMAEREYKIGKYYVSAGAPVAAEYQFGLVQHRWPKSKWAKLSKQDMVKVAKAPRKEWMPSKIMTLPGAPDPGQNQGGMGGMMNAVGGGGMGGGGGGMGGGGMGGGGGAPY